jgi:hypothetical protein
MGAPLAGDTGNLFGPVPLASLGLIVMQPIAIFQPQNPSGPNLGMSADGNLLKYYNQAGTQVLLTQGGVTVPIVNQSFIAAGKIAPEWMLNGRRVVSALLENYPKGFVSGSEDLDYVSRGILFRLYDDAQNLLVSNYSIPTQQAESGLSGGGVPFYEPNMFSAPSIFGNTVGYDEGTGSFGTGCLKQDDFGARQNGLYYTRTYFPVCSPPYTINTMRYACDLSKTPEPSYNVNMESYVFTGLENYRAGLGQTAATNTSAPFQNLEGAYAANFSAAGSGGGYYDGTICNSGFNCQSFAYFDMALSRALPPRMAQDQYLIFNMQTQGGTQTIGQNSILSHQTRFLNSATYAQTIYQPGFALNETMSQFGVSTEYPECQLPTVGIFGSNGQVNYSNVIPQNFEKLDLVLQPDLLWVSPNGQVLGVYHAPGSENYYFMIGGTRATYQSSVYNYRYGVS